MINTHNDDIKHWCVLVQFASVNSFDVIIKCHMYHQLRGFDIYREYTNMITINVSQNNSLQVKYLHFKGMDGDIHRD